MEERGKPRLSDKEIDLAFDSYLLANLYNWQEFVSVDSEGRHRGFEYSFLEAYIRWNKLTEKQKIGAEGRDILKSYGFGDRNNERAVAFRGAENKDIGQLNQALENNKKFTSALVTKIAHDIARTIYRQAEPKVQRIIEERAAEQLKKPAVISPSSKKPSVRERIRGVFGRQNKSSAREARDLFEYFDKLSENEKSNPGRAFQGYKLKDPIEEVEFNNFLSNVGKSAKQLLNDKEKNIERIQRFTDKEKIPEATDVEEMVEIIKLLREDVENDPRLTKYDPKIKENFIQSYVYKVISVAFGPNTQRDIYRIPFMPFYARKFQQAHVEFNKSKEKAAAQPLSPPMAAMPQPAQAAPAPVDVLLPPKAQVSKEPELNPEDAALWDDIAAITEKVLQEMREDSAVDEAKTKEIPEKVGDIEMTVMSPPAPAPETPATPGAVWKRGVKKEKSVPAQSTPARAEKTISDAEAISNLIASGVIDEEKLSEVEDADEEAKAKGHHQTPEPVTPKRDIREKEDAAEKSLEEELLAGELDKFLETEKRFEPKAVGGVSQGVVEPVKTSAPAPKIPPAVPASQWKRGELKKEKGAPSKEALVASLVKGLPIILSDVDGTLLDDDAICNMELVNAWKARGITEISFLTAFSAGFAAERAPAGRFELIEFLKEKGIRVKAVITQDDENYTRYIKRNGKVGSYYTDVIEPIERLVAEMKPINFKIEDKKPVTPKELQRYVKLDKKFTELVVKAAKGQRHAKILKIEEMLSKNPENKFLERELAFRRKEDELKSEDERLGAEKRIFQKNALLGGKGKQKQPTSSPPAEKNMKEAMDALEQEYPEFSQNVEVHKGDIIRYIHSRLGKPNTEYEFYDDHASYLGQALTVNGKNGINIQVFYVRDFVGAVKDMNNSTKDLIENKIALNVWHKKMDEIIEGLAKGVRPSSEALALIDKAIWCYQNSGNRDKGTTPAEKRLLGQLTFMAEKNAEPIKALLLEKLETKRQQLGGAPAVSPTEKTEVEVAVRPAPVVEPQPSPSVIAPAAVANVAESPEEVVANYDAWAKESLAAVRPESYKVLDEFFNKKERGSVVNPFVIQEKGIQQRRKLEALYTRIDKISAQDFVDFIFDKYKSEGGKKSAIQILEILLTQDHIAKKILHNDTLVNQLVAQGHESGMFKAVAKARKFLSPTQRKMLADTFRKPFSEGLEKRELALAESLALIQEIAKPEVTNIRWIKNKLVELRAKIKSLSELMSEDRGLLGWTTLPKNLARLLPDQVNEVAELESQVGIFIEKYQHSEVLKKYEALYQKVVSGENEKYFDKEGSPVSSLRVEHQLNKGKGEQTELRDITTTLDYMTAFQSVGGKYGRYTAQEDRVKFVRDVNGEFNNTQMTEALQGTYKDLQETCGTDQVGATLLTVVVKGNKIYTANAGDSVGFLVIQDHDGNTINVERLNKRIHDSNDAGEVQRLTAAGFKISDNGRVNGQAVFRSIGDNHNAAISHEPDVDITEFNIPQNRKAFVLLACDGLTEPLTRAKVSESKLEDSIKEMKLSLQEAAAYREWAKVHKEMSDEEYLREILTANKGKPINELARPVAERAMQDYTSDNVSVTVTELGEGDCVTVLADGHGGSQVADAIQKRFESAFEKNCSKVLGKSYEAKPESPAASSDVEEFEMVDMSRPWERLFDEVSKLEVTATVEDVEKYKQKVIELARSKGGVLPEEFEREVETNGIKYLIEFCSTYKNAEEKESKLAGAGIEPVKPGRVRRAPQRRNSVSEIDNWGDESPASEAAKAAEPSIASAPNWGKYWEDYVSIGMKSSGQTFSSQKEIQAIRLQAHQEASHKNGMVLTKENILKFDYVAMQRAGEVYDKAITLGKDPAEAHKAALLAYQDVFKREAAVPSVSEAAKAPPAAKVEEPKPAVAAVPLSEEQLRKQYNEFDGDKPGADKVVENILAGLDEKGKIQTISILLKIENEKNPVANRDGCNFLRDLRGSLTLNVLNAALNSRNDFDEAYRNQLGPVRALLNELHPNDSEAQRVAIFGAPIHEKDKKISVREKLKTVPFEPILRTDYLKNLLTYFAESDIFSDSSLLLDFVQGISGQYGLMTLVGDNIGNTAVGILAGRDFSSEIEKAIIEKYNEIRRGLGKDALKKREFIPMGVVRSDETPKMGVATPALPPKARRMPQSAKPKPAAPLSLEIGMKERVVAPPVFMSMVDEINKALVGFGNYRATANTDKIIVKDETKNDRQFRVTSEHVQSEGEVDKAKCVAMLKTAKVLYGEPIILSGGKPEERKMLIEAANALQIKVTVPDPKHWSEALQNIDSEAIRGAIFDKLKTLTTPPNTFSTTVQETVAFVENINRALNDEGKGLNGQSLSEVCTKPFAGLFTGINSVVQAAENKTLLSDSVIAEAAKKAAVEQAVKPAQPQGLEINSNPARSGPGPAHSA